MLPLTVKNPFFKKLNVSHMLSVIQGSLGPSQALDCWVAMKQSGLSADTPLSLVHLVPRSQD